MAQCPGELRTPYISAPRPVFTTLLYFSILKNKKTLSCVYSVFTVTQVPLNRCSCYRTSHQQFACLSRFRNKPAWHWTSTIHLPLGSLGWQWHRPITGLKPIGSQTAEVPDPYAPSCDAETRCFLQSWGSGRRVDNGCANGPTSCACLLTCPPVRLAGTAWVFSFEPRVAWSANNNRVYLKRRKKIRSAKFTHAPT